MPSPRLPNHLRTNRTRLALFQDDVAFLLGKEDGKKVSRYEMLLHLPNLETALAYEAIYKRPVSELFPSLYEQVERKVAERAKVLVEKQSGNGDPHFDLRQKTFAELAA